MTTPFSSRSAEPATVYIKPARGWAALNLRDLWRYRELIYFMTWRDLKVRYKQTLLGVSWAILQPFLTMIVFSIFFGGLAKIPTDNGIPYPIFAYAALLPFTLFTKALNDAGRSLVSNQNMITKIYFPRLVLPLSSVMSGLADFLLAFLVLFGLMLYYLFTGGYAFSISAAWLTLPLFILLELIAALGAALWLSALYVQYRDIGYVLPFISEFLRVISPVAYATSLLPEKWRLLYSLNPMVSVIDGFRWGLLGAPAPANDRLVLSGIVAAILLISGLFYFRRMERTFADTI
jgi:lipopolysaccharide transport system permease protein